MSNKGPIDLREFRILVKCVTASESDEKFFGEIAELVDRAKAWMKANGYWPDGETKTIGEYAMNDAKMRTHYDRRPIRDNPQA